MTVSAEWAQRNLGLQQSCRRCRRPMKYKVADADASIQRELIDYDSQGASGAAFAK